MTFTKKNYFGQSLLPLRSKSFIFTSAASKRRSNIQTRKRI